MDVYQMVARYCQTELNLYKESGYDQKFAQVETLKERKQIQDEHLEERAKSLTEVTEWAESL